MYPQLTSLIGVLTLCVSGIKSYKLTVVHTNDVHARFSQANKYGGSCSAEDASEQKCFGGVARRQTKMKEIRAQNDNVLFLDGGDQFQGTLWYYHYGGQAAAYFMNRLSYDVMAIGNHEFDREVEGLVPFLRDVNFNVLSANINATLEPDIAGMFSKSVVLTVGGEQIGIVGYTTKETVNISSPGRLIFDDEIDAVRAEVNKLMALGINKIIAVGHAGFTVDKKLAASVPGLDLVVGGHTNTFLYTGVPPSNENPLGDYPAVITQPDGSKVLCVQDYAFGKYLGFLQLTFDENGVVTSYEGNPILLDSAVPQDPAIAAEIASWSIEIDQSVKEVVGKTHVFLNGTQEQCRINECNLGNLYTDAMVHQNLRHSDSMQWNDVSIAISNSGGLRTSVQQGAITVEQVLEVIPFRNTIDIVEIRGRDIVSMFEYSASRFHDEDLFGGFLQISGIRLVLNVDKPVNSRVVSIDVICTDCLVPEYRPLDETQIYKIIMPSFIANGGDGYAIIREKKIRHHIIGDLDSEVLIEYIKQYSPITQGLEGRISFTTGMPVVCDGGTSATCSVRSFLNVIIMLISLTYIATHIYH